MKRKKGLFQKVKSYGIFSGGIFLGFLIGVYLALPSLEAPPVKDLSSVEPPATSSKKVFQFGPTYTTDVINGESLTVKWASLGELIKVYQGDQLLVLDIRSPEEYKRGHIKSAKLLPFAEIDNYYQTLPEDKEIIFYDNDPQFTSLKKVYKKLVDYNLNNVSLLEVTYDQWRESDNPVETGNPFEE